MSAAVDRTAAQSQFGLAIAAAALALDQLTKVILIGVMEANALAPIELTGFFNLVMVWNRGVSFGMLAFDGDIMRWVLIVVAIAVVALLYLFWLRRTDSRVVAGGLGLVIGGALGNSVDRLVHGAVADFFDFHLAGWHWPAFNVADSAIVVGVLLLMIDLLFAGRDSHK